MKKKKHVFSLKAKLMISTLTPVIISFVLVSAVIFLALFQSLREAAEAEFLQLSQKYAHRFETKLNDAMNYLSLLASELEMQLKAGTADRKILQETVFQVFDDYQLLDGSSIYFEPDQYDGRDREYLGTQYGTEMSGRMAWYFYKDEGKTAYLPEGLTDETEFDMPHYTLAKMANRPIYTDPVTHEVDGKHIPMFTLTYPINSAVGEFIGAVTVDLFLDEIYTQLQAEKIYETGYIIITNDHGQVIYSPRYEDIGRTRQEIGFHDPLPDKDEKTTFMNGLSMINGEETLMIIDSVYNAQLDSSFFVSASAPLGEIYANGTRLSVLLALFDFAVVTAIAFVIYLLVRRISAPLNEITESVDKIARGEYGARIAGEYEGEFAVVKDSVNKMAERIQAYVNESENTLSLLKNILNGLDAVIYVTIPDTGEIVFINDFMKEQYQITDDVIGRFCYEVLGPGREEKCEFCPCYQLDKEPDGIVVWEEYSALSKRLYRSTDRYINWIDGRKAHLQQSVDITDIKEAHAALDRRLEQQALMLSISQSFLSGENIGKLITNALQQTGEFMEVAQILFYKLEDDGVSFTCLSEYIDPTMGKQSGVGIRQTIPVSLVNYMKSRSKERVYCLDSNDPALKTAMDPYMVNFENYISAPIFVKGELYGALDFFRKEVGREWSESDINLAVLVSSVLSGVFERNAMEGLLRRLSSIVEGSPQLILYSTAEGGVDYVNPAVLGITGYTEGELIAGGLEIIFDEQTARDVREKHIPDTLRDGTSSFEIKLRRKDGRERIMAFSTFITGEGAASVGGIASDVTEMRELEAQLIAAKNLAEQGSRSKSEFLSRMSHEMRTPMNAVIGMTNIARSSGDLAKKEYCLERIDNASRHLLGVINDILDMSKIEADKFELSNSDFNFEHMLQRVMDVVNFRIEERHQSFNLHVDPSIPKSLIGDEQRLAQVITNLLSNAVKFTPEGGNIQMKVTVIAEEAESVTLQTEVIDSGIGISAEQQVKLFHSFEQADGSIARRFGGTGLGLAISKRIVGLMGGRIWVESDLGKGSAFKFTFVAPRGKGNEVALFSDKVNISDLHVLAVDDSPEVCEFFTHVMNELGISCSVAAGGAEALEVINSAKRPFDIVFVDWNMPGMNGVELTRALREQFDPKLVIIMISVAEWSDIQGEATKAGVDGFVPKPLFPSLLVECINRHLGEAERKAPEKEEDFSQKTFEGKTALLAEDVEINREIVLTVLEDTKIKMECAENGRQAVEMFSADPKKYDIILMDVQMPEVDGLEAARRIRAMDAPEGATVPIVAMTANVFQEDINMCLDAGMNSHIGKPIDFAALLAVLRRYLG